MSFHIDHTNNEASETPDKNSDLDSRVDVSDTYINKNNELDLDNRLDTKELNDIHLKELYNKFNDADCWNNLSDNEKKDLCHQLVDCIRNDLDVKNPLNIELYDKNDRSYGYYDSHQTIYLNKNTLSDGRETFNTIAHEVRHAWQKERTMLPEEQKNDLDNLLTFNNTYYVTPEDNYMGYMFQTVEMDANLYADKLNERLSSDM